MALTNLQQEDYLKRESVKFMHIQKDNCITIPPPIKFFLYVTQSNAVVKGDTTRVTLVLLDKYLWKTVQQRSVQAMENTVAPNLSLSDVSKTTKLGADGSTRASDTMADKMEKGEPRGSGSIITDDTDGNNNAFSVRAADGPEAKSSGPPPPPPKSPNNNGDLGWDWDSDPDNPYNWSLGKRWAQVGMAASFAILSWVAFFSLLSRLLHAILCILLVCACVRVHK